jgi:pseudouridine synthase
MSLRKRVTTGQVSSLVGATSRRSGRNQISLARAISKLGVASRAQATELVRRGDVTVNGRRVRDATVWVDPKIDSIAIHGKQVRPSRRIYLILHKPPGYLTTRSDELGRKTVYDLLPDEGLWVFPVGRLDRDSSGLLVFTNDTRLGNLLTSPLAAFFKKYLVHLDRPLEQVDREAMEKGTTLSDGTALGPTRITCLPNEAYEFILSEGKNRQIRRMCEAFGYEVRSLHRTAIGPLVLGQLPPGEVRPMTAQELALLLPQHGEPKK